MNKRAGVRIGGVAAGLAGAGLVAGCYLDQDVNSVYQPLSGYDGTIEWMGQGSDSIDCENLEPGQIHWVLTNPQGSIDDAVLEVDGQNVFDPEPLPSNVFHFLTDFFFEDVEDLSARAHYVGEAHPSALLVISAYCPSEKKEKKKLLLKGKKRIKDETKSSYAKGWKIEVYELCEDHRPTRLLGYARTGEDGAWHLKLKNTKMIKEYGLAVCEKQQDGWKQHAPSRSDANTVKVDGEVCHHVFPRDGEKKAKDGKTKVVIGGLDFVNKKCLY